MLESPAENEDDLETENISSDEKGEEEIDSKDMPF